MEAMETAEPDEFERLLAQLNGAPEGPPVSEPVVPMPVALAPPPVTVAPAFGVAVPFPGHAAASADFATAVPTSVTVPPAGRAPELMGADELAAPPRAFPPPTDFAPPLAAPPPAAPPAYGAPAAEPEHEPVREPAPEPVGEPAPISQLPSPAVPPAAVPPLAAPLAATPPPTAQQAPSPTAPRPPLDFATLLAAPVAGDDVSGSAAPPLNFGSAQPDDDEPDLGRSTLVERIGLVLAVLVAPIGLIVGIVAAVRSAHRRGWVVGVVRATIAIGAILTVVLAIGGYFEYGQLKQQQQHAKIAAESAAFCAAIKAEPSMDQLPTFGWPAVAASIPDSLKAMQAYEDRWTKLAKVSPAGIKPDVVKVAAAAKAIIGSVTVARTVDDASNIAVMSSIASDSRVPAWHSEYCG